MKLKVLILWIFYLQLGNAVDQGRKIFLIEAAKEGNNELMRWLIQQEANLDVQDDEGNTPLMHAINSTSNQIETIKLLLEAGADADIKNKQGKSVFHIAVEKELKNIVIMLEDKMKNINITDNSGRTGLHIAVMIGNEDIVSHLVTKGINLFAFDSFGFAAIHSAAMLGKTSIIRELRDIGININFRTITGSTPLILASLFERIDTVKFIVQYGGNISSTDNSGWSALHSAAYSGNLDVVQVLVENQASLVQKNIAGLTPMHLAASEGHLNVSKYLTEVGSNIYTTDNYNNNILHSAARSGNLGLLKFYYEKGVSINNINKNGSTPLLIAAELNNKDILKFLIDIDADNKFVDSLEPSYILSAISTNNTDVLKYIEESSGNHFIHNSELLHHAAKHCNSHMVNYLLQLMAKDYLIKKNLGINNPQALENRLKHCLTCYKAILKEQNSDGMTPLHCAVISDNAEAVEIFIKHGVDQSITDNNGHTAFHLAAAQGRTDILHKLATTNPNINTIDDKGKTALFLSAELGHLDALQYLIDIGADMFINDNRNRGLFHVAFENKHKDIVEALMNNTEYKSYIIQAPSIRMDYNIFIKHIDFVKDMQFNIAQFGLTMCKAVEYDNSDLIEYIHKNEKQPDFDCTGKGQNVFHVVALKGNGKIVEQLNKLYPFIINDIDDNRRSATWHAVVKEHFETVTQLELHGGIVLPNITIDEAVENDNRIMLKYLIKKGGNVDTVRDDGAPILFRAGVHGYLEIVKILVEAGANIEATYAGQLTTTLHIASNKGNCNVAEYLIKKGAKINHVDNSGNTPMDDSNLLCRPILYRYGAKKAEDL